MTNDQLHQRVSWLERRVGEYGRRLDAIDDRLAKLEFLLSALANGGAGSGNAVNAPLIPFRPTEPIPAATEAAGTLTPGVGDAVVWFYTFNANTLFESVVTFEIDNPFTTEDIPATATVVWCTPFGGRLRAVSWECS